MQQRLDQFDILKGIGILLVLLGHLPIGEDPGLLIYTFHMPLFFFCSGVFFCKESVSTRLIKDIKSIGIPYLFFASILILIIISMSAVHNHSLMVALQSVDLNPFNRYCYPLFHTIWFLISLFFVKELFNAIYTNRLWITIALVLLCYVIAQTLQLLAISIPLFIDSALGMTSFYTIGYVFKISNLYNRNVKWYLSAALLTFYVVLMWQVLPFVDTRNNVYPWYLIVTAMIPILSLYYLSKEIAKLDNIITRRLKLFGMNSLFIFGLHGPIFDAASPFLNKFHCSSTLTIIILLAITLPLCIFIQRIVTKHFPYLIGKF